MNLTRPTIALLSVLLFHAGIARADYRVVPDFPQLPAGTRLMAVSGVAIDSHGDAFVSDGYGNSRVVKFDKDGKYLLAWGKKGKGEGEFNLPHAVRIDSKGLLYVADRENDRIQVFDQQGKFQRQFGGFAPFGL